MQIFEMKGHKEGLFGFKKLKMDDLYVDIKLDVMKENQLKLIGLDNSNQDNKGVVSKGVPEYFTEKHFEFKNETVMNTMPYFLTSKYQEILEESKVERRLKDSGMDFEQGAQVVAVGGKPVEKVSQRAVPGAGGPYTGEFLKSKFEEQKSKQKPKRGQKTPAVARPHH